MAKKRDKEGGKIFIFGCAVLAVGFFFGYGLVLFAGAAMMIAGMLPPTEKEEDDPI